MSEANEKMETNVVIKGNRAEIRTATLEKFFVAAGVLGDEGFRFYSVTQEKNMCIGIMLK